MHDHRSLDAPMSPERMQVRFGPRTVMVERFLLQLSKLRVADWVTAGSTFEGLSRGQITPFGAEGTPADATAWAEAEAALERAMQEKESARVRVSRRVVTLATATKGIAPRASYDALLGAALTAVFAIICRDELGAANFHLLYAPFATIIPIEELESPAA
ncbi:MAG TPA: hypothetical protein VFZ11_05240 [Gemmatimonadaceae bacterium]